METAPIAEFSFENYLIEKASISVSSNSHLSELNINFKPTGHLDTSNNKFIMTLEVAINNNDKSLTIEITLKAWFNYNTNDMNKLKSFISLNAPAIVFPYIRAYISSLTALSGIGTITLPTLNVTNIGKILEQVLTNE